MEPSTIKKLNRLNQEFYQKVASSFDQTRQYSWQGWKQLLPLLQEITQPFRVLDIGCGNARFAKFLEDNQFKFSYHGVDSSSELLEVASSSLKELDIEFQLNQFDVLEDLLNDSLTTKLTQKYDLVVAFGLLHHLPSFNLRQKLFKNISHFLANKQSLAAITAWQFAADKRFENKYADPSKINLPKDQLEKNDYILGWQDHPTAFRYCHFVDDEEIKKLSQNLENLKLIDNFLADGKSNQLNRYLILKNET